MKKIRITNGDRVKEITLIGQKGDFYFYLQKRSIVNVNNVDASYKVGYKAGDVHGSYIVVYERINKKKNGVYFKELNRFTPSQIDNINGKRIVYYVKKWIHKDMLNLDNFKEVTQHESKEEEVKAPF
jgi:hypothetical protein